MLEVNNLKAFINTDDGVVQAVDDVSFSVEAGQTVGIVGESGSGKSVLALSIMQLNPSPPTFYSEGEILFEGKNLLHQTEREFHKVRGNEISMIFQDPMSSLNPVFKIGDQLVEAIRAHQNITRQAAKEKAIEILGDVGIPEPEKRMKDYPHQFSGGMRQRVMIAIALACRPKLLIADEPTTALDVTIQAQILELMKNLQKKYGTAIIVITHDLGVVAQLADKIMVMYAGRIVEWGTTEDIFYRTSMPYTWCLLRSLPRLNSDVNERLIPIPGQPPSLVTPPKGCKFNTRCPFVTPECLEIDPVLADRGNGHRVACILSATEFEKQKDKIEEIETSR